MVEEEEAEGRKHVVPVERFLKRKQRVWENAVGIGSA
jgi:hypothetical protein